MLDEERVFVEKGEESIIRAFKQWGFKPITCSFRNFNTFGGSFHCATADIRRRGTLQSYF
jgi:glycine amidinotransferase